MKTFRTVSSIIIIILLVVVYPISMTLIKNEDFIGTYYCVSIKSDLIMEVCGTATGIIDQKTDEAIISDIDSMIVVNDAIYGICKNQYFLFNLSNRSVVYSSIPMPQYSTYGLLSPMEYYEKKTMYIDIVGLIVLLCSIFYIIKIGFFYDSKKTNNQGGSLSLFEVNGNIKER